jgi:hypothetical protein
MLQKIPAEYQMNPPIAVIIARGILAHFTISR